MEADSPATMTSDAHVSVGSSAPEALDVCNSSALNKHLPENLETRVRVTELRRSFLSQMRHRTAGNRSKKR